MARRCFATGPRPSSARSTWQRAASTAGVNSRSRRATRTSSIAYTRRSSTIGGTRGPSIYPTRGCSRISKIASRTADICSHSMATTTPTTEPTSTVCDRKRLTQRAIVRRRHGKIVVRVAETSHLAVFTSHTSHKRIKRRRRHTVLYPRQRRMSPKCPVARRRSTPAACYLGRRRQVRHVPAPAERLDELNARRHLLPAQRDGRLLVAEKRRLRRDDVEIWVDACAVSRRGEPQVPGR